MASRAKITSDADSMTKPKPRMATTAQSRCWVAMATHPHPMMRLARSCKPKASLGVRVPKASAETGQREKNQEIGNTEIRQRRHDNPHQQHEDTQAHKGKSARRFDAAAFL